MKKILLFLLCTSFSGLFAQQLEYSLTKSTETYSVLTSPTDITNNAWAGAHNLRMPFKFKYFGKSYDTVRISATSGIYFTNGGSDIVFFGTENYKAENNNKALSPISYIITGITPDRIIKIEFKNIHAQAAASESYIVNNQIWLYEVNNRIEFHFGPNTITDPSTDRFFIGIIDNDNSPYLAIDSTAAAPKLVRVINAGQFDGIPTHPVNGQVYGLTPTPKVSVNQLAKPYRFNQLENGFQLTGETPSSVGIYDLSGKLVETVSNVPGQVFQHELTGVAPGIYMVNFSINDTDFIEKIIVR
jgi:hypothetical protein